MADVHERIWRSDRRPWYLLARSEPFRPWIAETGSRRTPEDVAYLTSVVVAYGVAPGPWLQVGTRFPVEATRASAEGPNLVRDDMTDRLILSAAEIPEGEAFVDPERAQRRLSAARQALSSWRDACMRVDGADLRGWTCASGEHRITFAETERAIAFVQTHAWSGAIELTGTVDRGDLRGEMRTTAPDEKQ